MRCPNCGQLCQQDIWRKGFDNLGLPGGSRPTFLYTCKICANMDRRPMYSQFVVVRKKLYGYFASRWHEMKIYDVMY